MVFNIAIVGCGPAGSLLARLLAQSKQDLKVTIFESEANINFRSQGGTLDLHEKTGQEALKQAGLFEEFLKHARYDGEALKLSDKNLLCYVKMGGSKKGSAAGRPEIDRPRLRELLFNSLPSGIVQWNKKLTSVDGNLTLHFADGSSQTGFDLIVGADGAWSKIRTLLSDAKPFYSGIGGHALSLPDAEKNAPELSAIVNRGSVFSFGDGKSIMTQQMGDGSLNIYTFAVRPTNWQQECGYDVHDMEAVKAAMREEYADWDPRLLAFTQKAQGAPVPRDLFMLPIGHSWKHVPGVTLVGDAAHLMTPFAGEGVNLAFEDSLKLSEAILSAAATKNKSQLDQRVAEFEQDMFKRATLTQQLTYENMQDTYFTPGAPRQGIERYVIRAVGGEMGPVMTTLLTPIVYAWFFVFKLIW